ncbi:MAG: zinc dependent phospholipase C family protein, partial [Candidatus Angelobacter sp.]
AHAYAYGGCLVQDMGYYPGGNKFFSDLVHYVRSGDFVSSLILQAQDVNELAFALGALAHYASDITGHPTINRAVALEFPRLRKKYGDQVTYAEDPISHIQTEFGFDVLQVAQHRYTSQAYHDFIGFQVAQSLLERAFFSTYGIPLSQVLTHEDLAMGSFRHDVATWMPRLTQVALITKKDELKNLPHFDPKKFRYILKRSEYEKEWGNNYHHPGLFAHILAVIVKILPKVGPLRALNIKPPTAQTEKMYIRSVESTVAVYREELHRVSDRQLALEEKDLDTGQLTSAGEYKLADRAYARLLKQLARQNFSRITPALRANILTFYGDLGRPFETKRHRDDWQEVLRNLDALKDHSSDVPVADSRKPTSQ